MRALAADTVAAAMPRAVERRQARHPGLVDADPGIVVEGGAHIVFERGLRPAAEKPAMRAGDDDRVMMLGRDQRGGIERPDLRRVALKQKRAFERRRRRMGARLGLRQGRRGVAAGHPQANAERHGQRIGVADDAARQHVGAIADPRRVVADRRGGNAEIPQVVEPADPGVVAPDPGIVEDRRGDAELGREIGGIDAAMRGVDDDRPPGLLGRSG